MSSFPEESRQHIQHSEHFQVSPDFSFPGAFHGSSAHTWSHCPHSPHTPKTVTPMNKAAGHGNTCHSKLNEHLPATAGKVPVLMTFPALEESTNLEGERVECDGSSSRHECHRFPPLLLKVYQFLKHKHSPDCCKPFSSRALKRLFCLFCRWP